MISTNEFKAIAELDLDPIKVKLMHAESGEGWTRGYADLMEFEYRRFLCLTKMFGGEAIAPLMDVDVFWHYHILDTLKYAADCEHVFGHFLHHYPYLGLSGDEDQGEQQRSGNRMMELYEQTFGEPCVRAELEAGAGVPAQRGASAAAGTAWCFVTENSAKAARTAWCFATENSAKGGRNARRFEGGHSGKAAGTAWCFVTENSEKAARTAWCFAPENSAEAVRPAWRLEGMASVKLAPLNRVLGKQNTQAAV